MILRREGKVQGSLLALRCADQTLFKAVDKAVAAEFQILALCRAAVKRNAVLLALVVNVENIALRCRTIHLGEILAVLEHVLNVALDLFVAHADFMGRDFNSLVLAEFYASVALRLLRKIGIRRSGYRALARIARSLCLLLAASGEGKCHCCKAGHQQQLFR